MKKPTKYKIGDIFKFKDVYLQVVDSTNYNTKHRICSGCFFEDTGYCVDDDYIYIAIDRDDNTEIVYKLYPLIDIRKQKLKKLNNI